MANFVGLEKITPSIIKFPFEQLLRSVINLKIGRKVPSSIAKIFAFIGGLAMGYLLPEIGNFMAFFLGLFVTTPFSAAVISTITVACSMILSASALMYLTKKMFQFYYEEKYGVSNPELRLTDRDRNILFLKFAEANGDLENDDINKKINELNNKITYMLGKIKIYKLTNQDTHRKTAKLAVTGLKIGDTAIFDEYFNTDYIKKISAMPKEVQKSKDKKPDSFTAARYDASEPSTNSSIDGTCGTSDKDNNTDYDDGSEVDMPDLFATDFKEYALKTRNIKDKGKSRPHESKSNSGPIRLSLNLYGLHKHCSSTHSGSDARKSKNRK